MTGADWLLEALEADGVEMLFGNPGSTELPLLDALGRRDAPRYVLGLHEGVVMGMADGYAQQSGRLAAVNVHVQPGLANAMAGILNAARARVPLLVTVGQQATGLLDEAPFLGGDVIGMASSVAKAAWEVPSPTELAAFYSRAVRTALEDPPGPVVLSLPLDVQYGAVDEAPAPTPPPPAAPRPEPAAVAAVASRLEVARAPVILAGDAVRDGAADVAALADALGAPIWGEPFAAQVGVPTDHPLYRGLLPGFAADIRDALSGHDVVLALGMPVFRCFGESPGPALRDGQALIHVEVDPAEIGRVIAPDLGVCADPAAMAEALAVRRPDARAAGRGSEWRERIAAERRAARAALDGAGRTAPVSPAGLCAALGRGVGASDLVVDEALTAGRLLRRALPRTGGSWLAHRGSALGWGLPAAVGAALADRDRRVMAIQGDGGVLFGLSALWTAAAESLPLALVIADNGGYEILRAGLEAFTGRAEGPWPGITLDAPRPDLAALARGFGADATAVPDGQDLDDAISDLWQRSADGPAVLIVPVTGRSPAHGHPPPRAD